MVMDMATDMVPKKSFRHGRHWPRRKSNGTGNGVAIIAFSLTSILYPSPAISQGSPRENQPNTSTDTSTTRAQSPTFRITPSIELNERYTDNAALVSTGTAEGDWVTDASAGVRVDYRAARATGLLDFRVNRLIHGNFSSLNSTQHRLDSSATLEAVEKWLFIDARASIAQQNRSAFGVADIAELTSARANRIETTTYQFAPYVRGEIANIATYQIRATAIESRTGESAFPDSKTYELTGFAKSPASSDRLGWTIDGSSVWLDNLAVDRKSNSRILASLTLEVDAQFLLSAGSGRESTNLDGAQKRTRNNFGFGFEWSPSQRTQLTALTQKRFFGNDHRVSIFHRTSLSAWSFSSAKEIVVSGNELSASTPASVNSLLSNLLASTIADPIGRTDATQRQIEQTGIPASSGIQDGLLGLRPTLSRRLEASVVFRGSRNTFTLAIGQREQRLIDPTGTVIGNIASTEEFRQTRYDSSWAYRLSRESTLRLVFSQFRTEGLDAENKSTTQKFQGLFFVTQLGPRASTSLGIQRVLFDSTVATSYRENVFLSSLSIRF